MNDKIQELMKMRMKHLEQARDLEKLPVMEKAMNLHLKTAKEIQEKIKEIIKKEKQFAVRDEDMPEGYSIGYNSLGSLEEHFCTKSEKRNETSSATYQKSTKHTQINAQNIKTMNDKPRK